jgi:hypothetical protein
MPYFKGIWGFVVTETVELCLKGRKSLLYVNLFAGTDTLWFIHLSLNVCMDYIASNGKTIYKMEYEWNIVKNVLIK